VEACWWVRSEKIGGRGSRGKNHTGGAAGIDPKKKNTSKNKSSRGSKSKWDWSSETVPNAERGEKGKGRKGNGKEL